MSQSRAVGALFAVWWAGSGFVVRATVSTARSSVVGLRLWHLCYVGKVAPAPVLLFNASILALCVPEIVFICCLECSDALQMSSAFSRVRSDSLSSLLRIVWLLLPHIIPSLIKPSLRSLNSHVDASFLSSVAYWSIVSPCSWFLMLNLCRSNVMFLRGLQ